MPGTIENFLTASRSVVNSTSSLSAIFFVYNMGLFLFSID
uniref:Uncharacterized protein n=1 Tax=Moniliophthora roreri TaxID=221103 RepID=A0A0W0F2S3_MONRR